MTSLLWLKEQQQVIGEDDLAIFEEVKKYRNLIAHGIQKMILDGPPLELPDRFSEMVALLDKIEKWWILNVEIPIREDLADREIDPDEIIPGPIASIKMMLDVALGDDEQAEYYINEFTKKY